MRFVVIIFIGDDVFLSVILLSGDISTVCGV